MIKSFEMYKKVKVYLIYCLVVISTISNSYAQIPTSVNQNDLSTIKIDELSDEQIKALITQGGTTGVTIEQAEKIAISKGMPSSEIAKLKARVEKLDNVAPNTISNNSTISIQDEINSKNSNSQQIEMIGKGDPISDLKRDVKVYGHEYFRNSELWVYDKSSDAKAPDNYVIGIGDEVGISVFGFSYYNQVLKVDSRGAINPEQMGPVFVKGLTFEKAKGLIKAKMGNYFDLSNNRIEITLAYSRSITVNIVGEVFKPGSYKMPALNTAFNALIIAGGPNDIGSLRKIQIQRNGKLIRELDVYEFLNNPNSKQDYYLENNDYIIITPADRIIQIKGQVNRQMLYELKGNENLMKLIGYAGLTSTAYTKVIKVTRITPLGLKVQDVKLDSLIKSKGDFILQKGDVVEIRSTSDELRNVVRVNGAVQLPGVFEYKRGDRVSDLLNKAGGIRFESLLEKAYLIRTTPDQSKEFKEINLKDILANNASANNILIEDKDVLTVVSYNDFLDEMSIEVVGEVRKGGQYLFSKGMTLGDALFLSEGLKIGADNLRIEVSRVSLFSETYVEGNPSRIVFESIKIPKDLNLTNEQLSIKLQPFDQIFVRTIPDFEFQRNMTIVGEVKYPGVYTIRSKDEKISNILKRAGGLNRFAFTEGASFYRAGLPGGFIVLNLKEVLKNENSKYNFTLKEGDLLTIPTVIDFIGIRGSSIEYLSVLDRTQVNAPFVKGKRARYYINEFGNGFSKQSWRRKTYVLENNAKINKTKNFVIFKVYPKVRKGSTIYVVEKPVKEKTFKAKSEPVDWNKFIENTLIKITGLATVAIIFRQL